jgi:hypothetical protein
MNNETEQEVINIYHECSTYYEYVLALARHTESVKKLTAKPIIYKGESDIGAIHNVLKYRYELKEAEAKVQFYTMQLPLFAATIAEAFKTAGVPPDKKIQATYFGDLTFRYDINYWYDTDDQLHYEMKQRWKA